MNLAFEKHTGEMPTNRAGRPAGGSRYAEILEYVYRNPSGYAKVGPLEKREIKTRQSSIVIAAKRKGMLVSTSIVDGCLYIKAKRPPTKAYEH